MSHSPKNDKHGKSKGIPRFVKGSTGTTYCIGPTLGKGGFGIVKLATNEATGQKFAAKAVDMKIVHKEGLLEYVNRETKLAAHLHHPHIIELVEVIELPEDNLRLYIMELAPNGELFDQIVAVSRFQEATARRYYQQLISAVRYCHSKGVVHRDLKAENLLVSRDNMLKVCDFGLSRYANEGSFTDHPIMFTSIAGSLDYQAPEIVRNQKYFGKPADIWSCGVILGFMLSGWLPFQDHAGDGATKRRIMKLPRPEYVLHEDISKEARDLIEKCLDPDPQSRITADMIIQHPWFTVGLDPPLCDKLLITTHVVSPVTQAIHSDGTAGNFPSSSPLALDSPGIEDIDKSLLRQLRVAFDTIDTDGSGTIKFEELRDVLIKLNQTVPTKEEVKSLLTFFDKDLSGTICFKEFVMGYAESSVEGSSGMGVRMRLKDLLDQLKSRLQFDMRSLDTEYITRLREAFQNIDEDKTGVINRAELKHLIERTGIADITDADLEKLFNYMDVGKNDYVTFEEFVHAWTSEETEDSSAPSDLLARLRKCNELLFLSEADEARRILYQANLGVTLKGDTADVLQLAKRCFASTNRMTYRLDEEGDTEHHLDPSVTGFRVACTEGTTVVAEVNILVAPALTGYCNVLTRRVTGATLSFHNVYKEFSKRLFESEAYKNAVVDLEEDGVEVEL